jgi:MFS family permease
MPHPVDVIGSLDAFEKAAALFLGWPAWALRVLALLSAACLSLLGIVTLTTASAQANSLPEHSSISHGEVRRNSNLTREEAKHFRAFQFQYLLVYLLIMFADWLQGTNMYTLYSSYNVNVAALFNTGFMSSAIFGTFLGVYTDRWGRRLGCIIFCVLEIIINLLEHVPNMPLLMFGRILGGMSTSLLFSTFESWYVSEHRKRGYPEPLLEQTFGFASSGNGLAAILAGVVAQKAADLNGDIGPFQVAILLTVICLGLVWTWTENRGDVGEGEGFQNIISNIKKASRSIKASPEMLLLGLSQAVFEGAVYTFVFTWVPAMLMLSNNVLPIGLVFAMFMLSMTIGGLFSNLVLSSFPGGAAGMCCFVYIVSAASMFVPIVCWSFWPVFCAFLVLEAMVGVFNTCGATMRSQIYPEAMQSSVMNVFRVPLNLIVVMGTFVSDSAGANGGDYTLVFGTIVSLHCFAFLLQVGMQYASSDVKPNAKKVN